MTSHKEVLGPKILNHDTFDFSKSDIIHPGTNKDIDSERSLIKKVTIFTVDSRDRNQSTFPTPSKYVIDLDDEICDVVTAELIDAHIPFKSYIVNKNNNLLSIEVEEQTIVVEIDLGDYTPLTLATILTNKIQNKVNTKLPTFEFKVEYDSITDKFQFYSNKPFLFHFEEKNIKVLPHNAGKLLGFDMQVHASKLKGTPKYTSTPHELQAKYRKNFEEQEYALLKISGFHVQHSINQIIDRTFAIIPQKKENQNVFAEFHSAKRYFNPPIARMTKLQISFVDYNGQPIDFQNHDHYFTIRFESFKHIRKYATFLDIPTVSSS